MKNRRYCVSKHKTELKFVCGAVGGTAQEKLCGRHAAIFSLKRGQNGVIQRLIDSHFQAIVSGEEAPHFTFHERWVPIFFRAENQIDRIMHYLSDFLDSCDTLSAEVCNMVSSDRIRYILNVMLSQVCLFQHYIF